MQHSVYFDLPISDAHLKMLLNVTDRTLYRWRKKGIPHMAKLIIGSIKSDLPILTTRKAIWEGWSWRNDGALHSPGGYPFYPGDLIAYEFLNRNGWIRKQCESNGYPYPYLKAVK